MTRKRNLYITAGIWMLGMIGICLIYRKNELPVSFSGMRISGGSGSVPVLAFSRWLCVLLPLYISIGFDLYIYKKCRPYLMIRYASYQKWWRHWCLRILMSTGFYFSCLGMIWQIFLAPEKHMIVTVLVHIMSSGLFLLIFLLLWECFLFDGSVLVLCFVQFLLLWMASFFPEKICRWILPWLGISCGVSDYRELLFFLIGEMVLIAGLFLGVPGFMAGRGKSADVH